MNTKGEWRGDELGDGIDIYTLQKLYIETINRELGKPTAEDPGELYSVLRDDPNDHQKRVCVYIYTAK